MANNENLKPIKKGELSKEEAKKRGSKGGKASVKARRKLKKIKEYLEIGLELAISDKQGNTYSRKEAGVLKLIERYVKGDPKAFDTVVELLGEKPEQKINLNGGVEVQKVFIDEKTKEEAKKHIEEFLDD